MSHGVAAALATAACLCTHATGPGWREIRRRWLLRAHDTRPPPPLHLCSVCSLAVPHGRRCGTACAAAPPPGDTLVDCGWCSGVQAKRGRAVLVRAETQTEDAEVRGFPSHRLALQMSTPDVRAPCFWPRLFRNTGFHEGCTRHGGETNTLRSAFGVSRCNPLLSSR